MRPVLHTKTGFFLNINLTESHHFLKGALNFYRRVKHGLQFPKDTAASIIKQAEIKTGMNKFKFRYRLDMSFKALVKDVSV